MLVVDGYTLPTFSHPASKMPLYAHQIEMYENWHKPFIFLSTKTGSGKTVSFLLPIINHNKSGVFVYPTNALIADQKLSYCFILEKQQKPYQFVTPENYFEKVPPDVYQIIEINADLLADFKKTMQVSHNGEALRELLRPDGKKLVLINPDILYLLLSLRYTESAETLSYLQSYEALVFDEFHLYTGLQFINLCFMVFMANKMQLFRRYVFSSATPDENAYQVIQRLFSPYYIEQAQYSSYPQVGRRKIAHRVYLDLISLDRNQDKIQHLCRALLALYPTFKKLKERHARKKERFVPALVILNSVIQAKRLEALLIANGIPEDEIGAVRGLASPQKRNTNGRTIIIGTSAVEVGVDFKIAYLFFEASDSSSFLQRFGRAGRHAPAHAYLYLPEEKRLSLMMSRDFLKRNYLEKLIQYIYPHQNTRAWLVTTMSAMLLLYVQVDRFLNAIAENKPSTNYSSSAVREWMESILDDFAKKVENPYKEGAKNRQKRDWYQDFLKQSSFRHTSPRIWILDKSEKNAEPYEIDLGMALRWGVNMRFANQKESSRPLVIIDGYLDKPHKVNFQRDFINDPQVGDGVFYSTRLFKASKDGNLLVNGEIVPYSDYFTRDGNETIFVVVPTEFRIYLDWSIRVYSCGFWGDNLHNAGQKIIAFGGDALVLYEIYRRYKDISENKG